MKVVVGSKNPVKSQTVEEAFKDCFPNEAFEFTTYDAPSGVNDQPMSHQETIFGARNRARVCAVTYPDADYFVGLEGGIEKIEGNYWIYAWMVVRDKHEVESMACTEAFMLPTKMRELLDEGMELGHVADKSFNTENSKHKGGTTGILTNGLMPRSSYYKDAIIFALVRFMKPELYEGPQELTE